MADPIFDPIETDPATLEQQAIDWMQSRWPNWDPNDGGLVAWLIGNFAQMIAEARDVASDVPPAIFYYFGNTILGLPPTPATFATAQSTWNFSSNPAGRTIPAGTTVTLAGPDDVPITFETVADVVVASPTLSTPAGAVTLRALESGTDANNLGGVGVQAQLIDPLAFVTTAVLTSATAGGADIEDIDAYLGRLSARLTLLTPRPILPRDFELLAVDLAEQAGESVRALGLDGYDPVTLTFNNERVMTVAIINADTGANAAGATKTAVQTGLDAQREVNFIVNVIDPTLNTFDVTYTIKVLPDYDATQTVADVTANIRAYLNPVTSGQPPGQEGVGWVKIDMLRRQEISTVINNTLGVDHWETLTIGPGGGGQTTAETFAVSGAAAVLNAGVVTGSAV